MAFLSKFGNLLKQTTSKQLNGQVSLSSPSLFQAIRCMSSSKLFVGGISYGTDDQGLRDAFSKYGEVIETRVIFDRETGRSRGFGFVTYTSSEEASSAIQALDGQNLDGRTVKVNYANDRSSGGGFGGGGGYGGGGGFGGGGGYGGSAGGYGGNSGGYGGNSGGYGGNSGGYGGNAGGYGGGASGGYGGGASGGYGGGASGGYGGSPLGGGGGYGSSNGSSFGEGASTGVAGGYDGINAYGSGGFAGDSQFGGNQVGNQVGNSSQFSGNVDQFGASSDSGFNNSTQFDVGPTGGETNGPTGGEWKNTEADYQDDTDITKRT